MAFKAMYRNTLIALISMNRYTLILLFATSCNILLSLMSCWNRKNNAIFNSWYYGWYWKWKWTKWMSCWLRLIAVQMLPANIPYLALKLITIAEKLTCCCTILHFELLLIRWDRGSTTRHAYQIRDDLLKTGCFAISKF